MPDSPDLRARDLREASLILLVGRRDTFENTWSLRFAGDSCGHRDEDLCGWCERRRDSRIGKESADQGLYDQSDPDDLLRSDGLRGVRTPPSSKHVTSLPVSFEVIADDDTEMSRQARRLPSWGDNVFAEDSHHEHARESARRHADRRTRGGRVATQRHRPHDHQSGSLFSEVLNPNVPVIVSVFAGRIADAGVDPIPVIDQSLKILAPFSSGRGSLGESSSLLNIVQAASVGCHIITMTNDLLAKLPGLDRDLETVSLDTVRMFYNDAVRSGQTL